jgi:hypothetical protein
MKFGEFLRPTRLKVVLSLLLTLLLVLYLRFSNSCYTACCALKWDSCISKCSEGNLIGFMPVHSPDTCCANSNDLLWNYFWNVLMPFIAIYVVLCIAIYLRTEKRSFLRPTARRMIALVPVLIFSAFMLYLFTSGFSDFYYFWFAILLILPGIVFCYFMICLIGMNISKYNQNKTRLKLAVMLIVNFLGVIACLAYLLGVEGLFYVYINGIFGARAGVVLSMDSAATFCRNHTISITMRNDGLRDAENVLIDVTYPNTGRTVSNACMVATICYGLSANATCLSSSANVSGLYTMTVHGGGSTLMGTVYCP